MARPITLPLRLGLVFFDQADELALKKAVQEMHCEQLPWVVVSEAPVHALLLARGPRAADSPDEAIFRLAVDAEWAARKAYGDALPPLTLRKPFRPLNLKLMLVMAAQALVPEYIAGIAPVTRPRIGNTISGPTTISDTHRGPMLRRVVVPR